MRIKSQFSSFSTLLLLFSLGLFAASSVSAQVDEKEKAQKELERRQQLERNTLALLDEVVAGAWGLKLAENRSFILTTAADLWWPHDEKRGRALFWEALNNLNLPTAALDESSAKEPPRSDSAKPATTKTPTKEQVQSLSRYYEVFGKRREFLGRVAQRDAQLALDMLRSTRQPPPRYFPGDFRLPEENDLEQEIANVAAAHDPTRALQIARESLAKGITMQLINVLSRLNQQDQNAASELVRDIIAKLDSEDLGKSLEALVVASELLSQSRNAQAVLGETPPAGLSWKPLKLDDEQKQRIVDMIAEAALSATADPGIMHNIQFVLPEIEQLAPDRAAKIKAKLNEWNRTLNKEQQNWITYEKLFDTATPEQMIKAADKMNGEQREGLYREAVIKAAMRGGQDTLREFINSQIADESVKNDLLESLNEQQIYSAVNRGKTEELQKLLPLIRFKEQRALAMSELAILFEKQGKHDEAVRLLEDARLLVKIDLNSQKQSNALLALLLAYALVDPGKAFAIIEPIIDRANDDVSKLLVLDKIVKSGAVKNGEILLDQRQIPIDYSMFKYSAGVVTLAKSDFDRTKALADRFQRNELRTLARLMLAQAVLRHLEQTPVAKN
jgi:hypothetical protein